MQKVFGILLDSKKAWRQI